MLPCLPINKTIPFNTIVHLTKTNSQKILKYLNLKGNTPTQMTKPGYIHPHINTVKSAFGIDSDHGLLPAVRDFLPNLVHISQ